MSGITRLSVALPNTKDTYMDCPLVSLYMGVATCILHLRKHATLSQCDLDFFTAEQCRLDYCVLRHLDVRKKGTIDRYTFEDVACALLTIEMNINSLDYHPDLEAYVDALELRVCELLLHTNVDSMLNNTMYRMKIRNLANQYCCSTSGEYYLIVSILAIRKLLTSALVKHRSTAVQRELLEDDHDMVEHIGNVFFTKYKNVHSDDIDDDFGNQYKEQKTFLFEIYLFQKLNGPDARLDYAAIISQFRNRTYWESVASASSVNIGSYLESPDMNVVAFRILFMQMAELLFQQQLRISWKPFCLHGEQIYRMDKLAYDEFVERSHVTPYFVTSFNDACIFYRGQLFVFGQKSRHYFHAFKEWLDIVASEHQFIVNETLSIRPLLEYICNEAESLRIIEREDTIINKTADSSLPKRIVRKMHAHDAFKYVLSGLNNEEHAADSSNTIGDVEASGLENSAICGWSFAEDDD